MRYIYVELLVNHGLKKRGRDHKEGTRIEKQCDKEQTATKFVNWLSD